MMKSLHIKEFALAVILIFPELMSCKQSQSVETTNLPSSKQAEPSTTANSAVINSSLEINLKAKCESPSPWLSSNIAAPDAYFIEKSGQKTLIELDKISMTLPSSTEFITTLSPINYCEVNKNNERLAIKLVISQMDSTGKILTSLASDVLEISCVEISEATNKFKLPAITITFTCPVNAGDPLVLSRSEFQISSVAQPTNPIPVQPKPAE